MSLGKACPRCQSKPRSRPRRRPWMRLIPGSKFYSCHHCTCDYICVLCLFSFRVRLRDFIERRQYARASVEWPVIIKGHKGIMKGVTVNLSADGAKILTQNTPEAGVVLAVAIRIPPVRQALLVKTRVVWSNDNAIPNRLGLGFIGTCFTNISDQHRKFIFDILADSAKPYSADATKPDVGTIRITVLPTKRLLARPLNQS